jgi:hypothetical protein
MWTVILGQRTSLDRENSILRGEPQLGEALTVQETADPREPIRLWRSAAACRDQAQLSALVQASSLATHLQEAGAAILTVAEDDPSGYAATCKALAGRLTERAWVGDGELAELLVAIADSQASTRRRIRADLDGVCDLLEGPPEMGFGGVLDCDTGSAWPEAVLDDWAGEENQPDPDAKPDRYLFVPNEGSHEAWEDMSAFATTVNDPAIRDRLLDAIDGRGAFSRFRRVLEDHETLRAAWYSYSAEARAGRARQWLYDAGFDALPPRL